MRKCHQTLSDFFWEFFSFFVTLWTNAFGEVSGKTVFFFDFVCDGLMTLAYHIIYLRNLFSSPSTCSYLLPIGDREEGVSVTTNNTTKSVTTNNISKVRNSRYRASHVIPRVSLHAGRPRAGECDTTRSASALRKSSGADTTADTTWKTFLGRRHNNIGIKFRSSFLLSTLNPSSQASFKRRRRSRQEGRDYTPPPFFL